MASDNKNYERTAADSPDDTDELDVLSADLVPTDEELEMDADTCSLDQLQGNADEDRSIADLRSDLLVRDERISSLQYDIEQLRSRWSGLEKEIEAREELTTMLQSDLKVAYKRLSEKDRTISRLKSAASRPSPESTKTVEADDSVAKDLEEARRTLDEMTRRSEADAERISALESELRAARDAASREAEERDRRTDYNETDSAGQARDGVPESTDAANALAELQSRYATRGDELARLRRVHDRSEKELKDSNAERGRISAMLKVAHRENADLKARLATAREAIDDFRQNEQPDSRQRLAAQEGRIADLREHTRRLEDRLAKSEQYADQLRRKIAAARDGSEDVEARARELAEALDSATRRVTELEAQVAAFEAQVAELESKLAGEREVHAEQLAALRAEVDGTQETAADRESKIDELTRDLSEAIRTRDELAQELEHSNRESAERIESLGEKLRVLDASLAEAEEKNVKKDNAISTLLNELASEHQSAEVIGEIEDAIPEVGGEMPERIDDPHAADKERPTRVLTGTIDGQELRFPLFKNRLTVGRTSANDIQLRAQYVSRKHAVLLIEGESTRIIDWGSKNGVYVNDARVSDKALVNGDRVTIGNAEFVFEERARRESHRDSI